MFSEYLQVSFDIIRGEWTDFGPSVIRPLVSSSQGLVGINFGDASHRPFLMLGNI
jgi:hypothetical protein